MLSPSTDENGLFNPSAVDPSDQMDFWGGGVGEGTPTRVAKGWIIMIVLTVPCALLVTVFLLCCCQVHLCSRYRRSKVRKEESGLEAGEVMNWKEGAVGEERSGEGIDRGSMRAYIEGNSPTFSGLASMDGMVAVPSIRPSSQFYESRCPSRISIPMNGMFEGSIDSQNHFRTVSELAVMNGVSPASSVYGDSYYPVSKLAMMNATNGGSSICLSTVRSARRPSVVSMPMDGMTGGSSVRPSTSEQNIPYSQTSSMNAMSPYRPSGVRLNKRPSRSSLVSRIVSEESIPL